MEVSCICFDEELEEKEERKNPAFEEWQICGKKSILGVVRIPIENSETLSESEKKDTAFDD